MAEPVLYPRYARSRLQEALGDMSMSFTSVQSSRRGILHLRFFEHVVSEMAAQFRRSCPETGAAAFSCLLPTSL